MTAGDLSFHPAFLTLRCIDHFVADSIERPYNPVYPIPSMIIHPSNNSI